MSYNLTARCTLTEKIELRSLLDWYSRETEQIKTESFRHVAQYVGTHWQDFVRFSEGPLLLWQGCDRVKPDGKKQKYHIYPEIRGQTGRFPPRIGVARDERRVTFRLSPGF